MSNLNSFKKEKLMEKIQCLYETDVGDFKRKVGLYLNRFLDDQQDSSIKSKVEAIKDFILYQETTSDNEMENVDNLRLALLERLKTL